MTRKIFRPQAVAALSIAVLAFVTPAHASVHAEGTPASAAGSVIGTAGLDAAAAPAHRPLVVGLQPLGNVAPRMVDMTARAIASTYGVQVVVLATRALPARAFYAARHRYRGEKILEDLDARTPATCGKVLAIISRDLSVTNGNIFDWGVMGVAGLARRAGVVSVFRMVRHGATEQLVDSRLRQVAIHELGHTFGLPHCASPNCIMNDARGTVRVVDASSGSFCPRCRRRLAAVMGTPPALNGSSRAPAASP